MEYDKHIQLILDEICGSKNTAECNYTSEFPSTLYKYRNLSNDNHLDIIRKSSIFFARPDSFDDNFDCHVPENVIHGKDFFRYCLRLSSEYLPTGNYSQRFFWALQVAKDSPSQNPKLFQKTCRFFYNQFCERFGVLSLTFSPNIDFMWEEYSEHHKGFCLGLDAKKLFDSFAGGCGPVQYVDTLPTVCYFMDSNDVQTCKNIYFKGKCYKNEKEFRYHTMWDHKVDDAERNIKMLPGTIKEIIIGKDASEEDEKNLREMAKKYCPDAKVSKEA